MDYYDNNMIYLGSWDNEGDKPEWLIEHEIKAIQRERADNLLFSIAFFLGIVCMLLSCAAGVLARVHV